VDLCPVRAFTGVRFDPAGDVEARFHRSDCRAYLGQRGKAYRASACGLCVYVCPHGWSAKRKRDGQRTTPEGLRRQLAGARQAFEATA
jgi:epoxyqueuosine reductase QueG